MSENDANSKKEHVGRSRVLDSRPEYERLGAWLRTQRESLGLQQKPLSKQLGKPAQYLNKVEQGKQRIDVIEFLDLLRLLKLDGTFAELARVTTEP